MINWTAKVRRSGEEWSRFDILRVEFETLENVGSRSDVRDQRSYGFSRCAMTREC